MRVLGGKKDQTLFWSMLVDIAELSLKYVQIKAKNGFVLMNAEKNKTPRL